jgi:pimeloyl-ACP methyl ester carboxylesterase
MLPFEENMDKPAIVLIHGAWADGSCWQEVIPILQKSGHKVVAAQLPLANFAEDVSFAKRVIEGQKGPVVVVGHSYGGAVITEAATKNANVKSLVFIAAFSPDVGESLKSLQEGFAQMPIGNAIVPAAAGFLYLDPAKFHSVMAHDLPESQAAALAAVQKPLFGASFVTPIKEAAWKTIPSWFLISTADRAIDPNQQRFGAKRMGAHATEVNASHLPMLSRPKEVAEIISAAAD